MITKSYAKNGQSCRVTFQFAPGREVHSAAVLGEFNDWRPEAHPMERRADGSFHLTVSLPAGRRYRFRYLVDGESWANDESADDFVLNQFGSQDAVLDLASAPALAAERPGRTAAAKPASARSGSAKAAKPAGARTKATPAGNAAAKRAATPKAPAAPRPASPAGAAGTRRRRSPEAE